MTMTLVSTVTVGAGGAASIDFTSIPQTGTDLLVVLSVRTTYAIASTTAVRLTLNNNTNPIYADRRLAGNGTAASSSQDPVNNNGFISGIYEPGSSATASTFGNASIYLPNYTSSSNKSLSIDSVGENNATASGQTIIASLAQTTAPVTSLQIIDGFTQFAQYSTASLYTITKGSGGASVS